MADDTTRIQAAVNAAGDDYEVYFPPGNYRITGRIDIPNRSTTWVGSRAAKGAGLGTDVSVGSQFSTSQITFAPSVGGTFLVSEFDATFPPEALGPYIFRDLYFELGSNNGFEFGRESLGAVTSEAGQRYISGVHFSGCAFNQTVQDFYPSGNTVSRLSTKAIWLTKAAESIIDRCSFMGGDAQIRLFGCDNPIVSNCRLTYGWNPYEYIRSTTWGVQGSLTDCQFESWGSTPIKVTGSDVAIMRCRMEQFGVTGINVTLGQTASGTAGAGTITMSGSVDNIIIPGASILKIATASGELIIYPTAVSGTTVTFDNTTTDILTSFSGASVKRIHGYGPILSGSGNVQAVGCSVSVRTGCPSFVMVPYNAPAHMSVMGAHGTIGQDDVGSIVVANKINGQFYMNNAMTFSDCSPVLIANPQHPYVVVSNIRNSHGEYGDNPGFRSHFGALDDALSSMVRKYAFRPGSGYSFADHLGEVPFVEIATAPSLTTEKVYCWRYLAAGPSIRLEDNTLPSESVSMKVRVKWRTILAGSATMTVEAVGHLSSATILTDTGNTSWKTSVATITTPAVWTGSGRTAASLGVGLNVVCSQDAYIVGVDVLEVDP